MSIRILTNSTTVSYYGPAIEPRFGNRLFPALPRANSSPGAPVGVALLHPRYNPGPQWGWGLPNHSPTAFAGTSNGWRNARPANDAWSPGPCRTGTAPETGRSRRGRRRAVAKLRAPAIWWRWYPEPGWDIFPGAPADELSVRKRLPCG